MAKARKGGLGKGLDSLIPQVITETPTQEKNKEKIVEKEIIVEKPIYVEKEVIVEKPVYLENVCKQR